MNTALTKQNLAHISYYDLNPKSPNLIVIFHGHRSDANRILPLGKALLNKYHLLIPDLPGSSNSPKLNQQHTISNLSQAMAKWLNLYLSHHQFKTFALFGLSMGGNVAIHSLTTLQYQPNKLFLYSTPTKPSEINPPRAQQLLVKILRNKFIPTSFIIKLTHLITSNYRIMKRIYSTFYPQLNLQTINFEIQQWQVQQTQVLVESMQDLLTNPTIIPTHNLKTIYIHPQHDDFINIQSVRQTIKIIFPQTQFIAINLTNHVPKGPLSIKFFQPFIQLIDQCYHDK